MQARYQFLFGPVPSRRFGRSLGVDLTPYKTCCLDCVFCQLGRTTNKTVKRQEYVATEAVMAELKHWLKTDGTADVITLSGSGEPTLHARFGEVLEFIRANTSIPAVLLTNGALLNDPEVCEAASHANVVKVSLSAWDQASFKWVNRPHPYLQFDQLINGQKTFRTRFKGQLWMEVFLIRKINSTTDNVRKIAALAGEIAPDRIQLNTAVRPPAEDFVAPLAKEQISALTRLFQPNAEIIVEFGTAGPEHLRANEETIFAMLQRRPCTANQIADVFGMHLNEVLKYLGKLIRADQIRAEWIKNTVYYVAVG
jgi:wyosine [tRNA(Phe)-imidazoG37] synthetase (radical SAM superfamily)